MLKIKVEFIINVIQGHTYGINIHQKVYSSLEVENDSSKGEALSPNSTAIHL